MNYGNFDKYPEKKVPGYQAVEGAARRGRPAC